MSKTFRTFFHDIIQQQVNEQDEKGYAKQWKHASDTIIQQMAESGFHAIDIEYLDCYFIFGYGSNSILHFHVQECPGWKFGIWWEEPEKSEQNYVTGDFFAQYEEIINKFKPSASVIKCNFTVDEETNLDWPIERELQFIRDEPYLAFCRDCYHWDYNHEYHTREEAKTLFDEYIAITTLEKKVNAEYVQLNQQLMLETLRQTLEEGEEVFMVDRGECWSPRYDLVVYSSAAEPGGLYIEDCDGWEEKEKQIQVFVDQYKDKPVWIHTNPISRYIYITDKRPNENESCKKVA